MTARNQSVSMNRRNLLRTTLVGSAALSAAGINGVLASGVAPYHFSRTAAYQDGTTITAVVPSFAGAGDNFMRAQVDEFLALTGIQVDLQFLQFERAMDRQTTVVAARSGEVDVFGTHYAQIGKFGEGMVPLNELAEADGILAEDYVGGSFNYMTVD